MTKGTRRPGRAHDLLRPPDERNAKGATPIRIAPLPFVPSPAWARSAYFVNGQPLTESYITGAVTFCQAPPAASRSADWCALTVPPDSVYVLGDNRQHSSDSRAFGPVRISAIVGKVFFTNWPVDRFGPVPSPGYDSTVP